jgi:putative membrane-bound dehydrogenase-like protein
MRVQIVSTSVLVTLVTLSAAPAHADDSLGSLTVPPGFTVARIAGPPLVERPIFASFDDRGRLYVADSAGVNLKGDELAKDPPHRILLIEDSDGDGMFDKSHVFADKIVFPQGLLWHDGAVFVASPPSLWRLDDTDGDGVCDRRTPLMSGFPLTGVSDDMHGACLGPDGFIYTLTGRFQHHIHDVSGKPIESPNRQPVMVRCRPDGSDAEVVCGTHGNGVEVAWSDEGEPFVSGTFYGGGTGMRDALIHAVEGGDFPVLNQPISIHKMKSTGELLPPMVLQPATAPAGMTRYKGDALGAPFRGNLFCTYFNLHAVHRHVLERDGATFRATDEPFLTSTSVDFHPTDVLEDGRDGSLLVVDTGGWFRIGCPTSQIAKPDVKGGIYRVRREGASRAGAAESPDPDTARLEAVWKQARVTGPGAREAVRAALADADPRVRQVAAYAAGLRRDSDAAEALIKLLGRDEPPVRREAANALGRISSRAAVPALLAALKGGTADRFLEHSIVLALIRIGDREATLKGLADADASVKRGVLLALDQMDDTGLAAEQVTPLLDPAEPALRAAAVLVLSRHPEWAAAMIGYFRQALSAPADLPAPRREELRQQLIAFAADPAIRGLIAEALADAKTPPATKLLLLEAMAEVPIGGRVPDAWAGALRQSLADRDEQVVRQTVLTIRSLPEPNRPVLTRVDRNVDFAEVPAGKPFPGTNLVDEFAVRWTGVLRVPRAGRYTFAIKSSDGAKLFLDGKLVVDNPGRHGTREQTGEAELSAGEHDLRLDYFQDRSEKACELSWSVPEGSPQRVAVPADVLLHREKGKPELVPGLVGEYFELRDPFSKFPQLDAVEFGDALLGIARDGGRGQEVRVEALLAAVADLDPVEPALLDLLLSSLDKSKPALLRAAAAEAVGRAKLTPEQLTRLAGSLAGAGPLELPKLLPAFSHSGDAAVGTALLAALDRSTATKAIPPAVVSETLKGYPPEVVKSARPLLDRLSATASEQKARLDSLEKMLPAGDAARGRAVFFGAKAVCATCHTVRGDGGHVGPDLSKIGAVRGRRDLLEAVVFPSATFARTFEPFLVKTKSGVESGVITRETADAIFLTTGPKSEKRIARSDIADLRRSPVSVMPEGLDAQLTPQEMGDLVAFVQSLK